MSINHLRNRVLPIRALPNAIRPTTNPTPLLLSRSLPIHRRYSSDPSQIVTEESLKAKLIEALNPSEIKVIDTSGGCGSFFNIDIVSKQFNGLSKVKQHKLVQDLLKKEVGLMHGLSLRTVPDEE